MFELDIPSISAIVAAIGVLVGVVLTVIELRNLVKQRQTDLVMRLYATYGNEEYSRAVSRYLAIKFRNYNDFEKKYGSILSEEPVQVAVRMVSIFYEGVGILLCRKLVDPDLVSDLFNVDIFWEKMKPIAEHLRKQFDDMQTFKWFEYLYDEMKKREQKLQQSKA